MTPGSNGCRVSTAWTMGDLSSNGGLPTCPTVSDGGGGGKERLAAEHSDVWKVNSFRTSLPQVLATSGQSLLLLALGMMIGVPTLVIAALLNAPSGLSMTSNQASWFAGVLLATQPLGSVLSGALSEAFGRKRCMMMVAVPQLSGWGLMYFSQDLPLLYVSGLLLGFSIGFMEAPCLSYVGEISQPHLRATLCSLTSMMVPFGYLVMYFLGTQLDWRTVAACSAVMPVITVLVISQVPESPLWLLRKDRVGEAEVSLRWLRGWVSEPDIRAEFATLRIYADNSKLVAPQQRSPKKGQVYIEVPKNGNGPRLESTRPVPAPTAMDKLKDLVRPEMLRPLRLVLLYFFFYHCGGLTGLRPYMVKVFHQLELTIDPYWLTVATAVLQIAGAVVCLASIHRVGKRVISLVSMSACSVSVILLGVYSLLTHHGAHAPQPLVPMGLFATLFFFTNVGISPVPWALISEVFPPRGRGMGGGVSSAVYYGMYFVVTKTFLDLEGLMGLHGVFFLYGGLGIVGLVYIYFYLPETEGRNLQEIEEFFHNKTDKE